MKVVCINWCNYQGRGDEYVERLRGMVARHLTIPHEFAVLTEKELGTDLKGWWVKMKLAEPGRFPGPVMYLDLDVAVTANINHLVDLAATDKNRLWMRDDFSYSLLKPRNDLDFEMRRLLGGRGCCNSSVMLWDGDALAPVWERWQSRSRQYMAECHGDQNVISQIMWPDRIGFLPNESIQSYKYGIRMRGENPAPIVVFHGNPKMPELPRSDPLRQMWEAA